MDKTELNKWLGEQNDYEGGERQKNKKKATRKPHGSITPECTIRLMSFVILLCGFQVDSKLEIRGKTLNFQNHRHLVKMWTI